jgi:hypothetical protein
MLPPSLYEEFAPYLEKLLEHVFFAEQALAEDDYQQAQSHAQRMRELRDQFEAQKRSDWVKFARQNWPDVDKYFDLARELPDDDDIPF